MGYTPGQRPWSVGRGTNWQGIVNLFSDLPNSAGSPYQYGVPNVQHGDLAWVSTGTPGLYLCIDPTLGAAIWVPAGTGGGGGVTIPNRRNHSVNGGACDDFTKTPCILRTNTTVNLVGGFTGGGIGNKGILGHWLPAPLPLGSLLNVTLDYELVAPENGFLPLRVPYMNLLVEFDPTNFPGVIAVCVIGDPTNPLNTGTFTVLGPNLFRTTWTPASFIQVVNDRGVYPGGAPPVPLFGPATIPTAEGPLPPPLPTWNQRDYSVANLLIAYPSARIVNANSLDGGLPRNTQTAGLLAVLGDSGTVVQNAVRINAWSLNGSPI